ncbi:MAG: hypothetical protein KGL53_12825, partial [Elusimicrobia bacterium]|nr:hypothetical protein [Elusimicrobiota bacterium]
EPSTNAAGDPITYRLDVQTSTGAWPSIDMGSGTSLAFDTLFETTYTWRVAAEDPYGGASTGPWTSFIVHLANQPPSPVVYTTPPTLVTRATATTLSWDASIDPDGDAVTYALYLSTSSAAQPLVQQGPQTGYALAFQYGTTYYWRVTARDSFGAEAAGALQSFVATFQNSPPPAPAVLGGTGSVGEHTLSPSGTLSWGAVADPDGDPVAYRLALGTSPAALAAVQDGTATAYALPAPAFGTTYYWQVTAYDPYGGTGATGEQGLSLFLKNSPPGQFDVLTGTGTLATRASSEELSWAPSWDPDGDAVTYELDLSTVPGKVTPVQDSVATSFTLDFTLGTTYYWQVVARDGFGGVTATPPQTFLPVFLNHPPTVPVNESKTGTIAYHGLNPSLAFFWDASVDPDGDAVTYSVSYGTDSSHLTTVSPAPLGLTSPNVPLDAAFYYRITATDAYGAASSTPLEWVYYQFTDAPPGPFQVTAGTGTVTTRLTSAELAWTASTDPDGDPVSYGVVAGTAPTSLAPLTETSQTSAQLSGLDFGTTYYWRVDAYDGLGATTTVAGGVQGLTYLFYDPLPSPVVYLSTASIYAEHTTSPNVTLAWQPSTNAAGDPIAYRLDVQTSTGAWPAIDMGSGTSLTFGTLFETTYTWRVAAEDPYGGGSTGPWTSFIVHMANQPPSPISYTTPGTLMTRATSTTLAWADSGDPDGDAVAYDLFLATSPSSQGLVQQGTQTAFALDFQFGTTYYWRVTARDSFGAETAGSLQTFVATFENLPPPAPAVLGGTGSVGEHTLSPSATLSWASVSDPDGDPVAYRLALGTAPASLAVVQDNTATSYPLPAPTFGTTYYWQVAAYDPYGGTGSTAEQSLSLFLRNSPPGGFDVQAGTGTLATRASSQLLSWAPSSDSDGDPVAYELDLSTTPGNLSAVQVSSATSFTL